MIITIDGTVGTGKSTIAKKLARAIGYIYFDTGAMYRAVCWAILKDNINPEDPKELKTFLDSFNYRIKVKQGEKRYFANEEDLTEAIRDPNISKNVSRIAAIHDVREKLVAVQRECSQGVNAIFEGRDLGSVVFPDAELKIFLTGSAEERARRRYEELCEKFPHMEVSYEQVLKDLNARDHFDMNREESPLKQAEDAYLIDTTELTPEEVVHRILEYKDAARSKFLT